MIELDGKYTSAKIFAETVEEGLVEQVQRVLDHPIFKDCPIRLMMDAHIGAGCSIGFTSPLPKNGEIIPNIIGVDQACSMLAVKLDEKDILNDYAKLDKVIRRNIPVGRDGRNRVSELIPEELAEKVKKYSKDILKENYLGHLQRLGSLGDGNHFISIEKGESGTYLIIHTGSRNIGYRLAAHFQNIAIEKHCYGEGIMKELSYIDGKDAELYLECAKFCNEYSSWNKKIIAHDILVGMRWKELDSFETVHNYIGADNIIRKGAISCYKSEKVLIPLNMADGSLICLGKGNEDYNYSGPHGAGRVLSRRQAKDTLSMGDYKKSMEGIYSSCVSINTLDEAPMAYKNGDEIKRLIEPTATVVDHLKPLYNFKADVDSRKR